MSHSLRLAHGGLVALPAMGVGRFAYTPILPAMMADLGLGATRARITVGITATVHFIDLPLPRAEDLDMARLVVPGVPHHVTQRGNGRGRTFFGGDDDALYRDLRAESCHAAGVEAWAWCPMPNHGHLVLVPAGADRPALRRRHPRAAGARGNSGGAGSDRSRWTRNALRLRSATYR